MSIVTQVQVFKGMMDPKVRFLPAISGMSQSIGYFRHAYCQSHYVISDLKLWNEEEKVGEKTEVVLLNLCRSIYHATKVSTKPITDFQYQVAKASILGMKVVDLLKTHSSTHTACIKFTRALMGMRNTMSSI